VGAPGIEHLVTAVARWAAERPADRSVFVVAPQSNQSGMSSAVGDVFSRQAVPFYRHHYLNAPGVTAYALDCPPALCVITASLGYFDDRPDLVLSGINAGANVGRSVLHSGTIGAILTGAQLGLSGLAVSVQYGEPLHFETAADVAVEVLATMEGAPERTLLNLNVPSVPLAELKGVRRGRISTAGLIKSMSRTERPTLGDEGELPLRLGAATPQVGDVSDEEPEDDGALVVAGYASLTSLRGVHEDTDPLTDSVVRGALVAVESHLRKQR
jgi:5'-nucleotidase